MWYCCFFVKQKTAYECRISDWSSDVCSSDLEVGIEPAEHRNVAPREADLLLRLAQGAGFGVGIAGVDAAAGKAELAAVVRQVRAAPGEQHGESAGPVDDRHQPRRVAQRAVRSEEPTSELQSQMRTSYAVFC